MLVGHDVVRVVGPHAEHLIRTEQPFPRAGDADCRCPIAFLRIARHIVEKDVDIKVDEILKVTGARHPLAAVGQHQTVPLEVHDVGFGDEVTERVEKLRGHHFRAGRHFEPPRRIEAQEVDLSG